MKRVGTAGVLVLVLAGPLQAQHRLPRKWLMAGIGALVTGALAITYAASFDRDIGGCSSVACVVPVTIGTGALIGFMIGSEMDKLYSARYRHAPPVNLRGRTMPLAVMANDLTVRDTTVLVTGAEGVEVIRAGPRLERLAFKARGLRGIGPVLAQDDRDLLLVGSSVGLYRFPLASDDPGSLAYSGEISALSSDGGLIALGLGPDLQLARVTADSVEPLGTPQAEDARVVSLAWQGDSVVWALTEERLAAYRVVGDSLALHGSLTLPAIGRRLVLRDTVALVAAGSGGLYAVDIGDIDQPAVRANWSGASFAYDVAFHADTVYLAAGPEGMYLLRMAPDGFQPLGLARGVGFAAAVEVGSDDAVYVIDRTGGTLRRIAPKQH